MKEYFTEAVVLGREDFGEADARVFLYTENFGRLAAKVKSIRKITSKLAGHLEPLNLIKARLVFGKNLQIVDALRIGRLEDWGFVRVLNLIKELSPENQADGFLWQFLKNQYQQPTPTGLAAREVLKIGGFDPEFAICQNCSGQPTHFLLNSAEYICGNCLQKSANKEKCYALS